MSPGDITEKHLRMKDYKNKSCLCDVRYVDLPARSIYNLLDVQNRTAWDYFPELRPFWWNPCVVDIRSTIGTMFKRLWDKKTKHFTQLQQSVKSEGFRNPIQVVTGCPIDSQGNKAEMSMLPPDMTKNIHSAVSVHLFGGSRLAIAQEIDINIPCIVYDFERLFPNAEEIVTSSDFQSKCIDPFEIHLSRCWAKPVRHSHIKGAPDKNEVNNRREVMNHIRLELESKLEACIKYCAHQKNNI